MSVGRLILALILCLCDYPLHGQTKRRVRAADFPTPWIRSAAEFDRLIADIDRRTKERLREGANDHLVAFLLQSSQFTIEPKIEPTLSAMEFLRVTPHQVPGNVSRRMDAFLKARPRPDGDERLQYFQDLVAGRGKTYLITEYARTMPFLYAMERGWQLNHPPADLYQARGYAVDTQVEANFAVWTALSVLHSLEPTFAANRILIVGPGLDLAPRIEMLDLFPPQSYQPFAIADAVLALGLGTPDRLRVHSVDINPLVVQFFDGVPGRRKRTLNLVSGLRRDQLSADFHDYFRNLGRKIGEESALDLPTALASHLAKLLTVHQDLARNVTAAEMNILTERYDPSPGYDLAVATNILVYFKQQELRLALANICSMLRPGGYLVHNELRPEVESIARELDLAPVQARTIQISARAGKPLLDGFVIHRRVVH
jgi:hypothetical protein